MRAKVTAPCRIIVEGDRYTMENMAEQLQEAIAVWRRAQGLRLTATWRGEPRATAFVELFAEHPESEASLVALLSNENQLVVAHALVALEWMRSAALGNLPEELLGRHEKLTVFTGSFGATMELGGLARQIRKRHRSKGEQPGPANG